MIALLLLAAFVLAVIGGLSMLGVFGDSIEARLQRRLDSRIDHPSTNVTRITRRRAD